MTPSSIFNSVAVLVTPSNIFNSAVVAVTPSSIFSSAVVIVALSNIFNSAAVVVAPSKRFSSDAVLVTAIPPTCKVVLAFMMGAVNVPVNVGLAGVKASEALNATTCIISFKLAPEASSVSGSYVLPYY